MSTEAVPAPVAAPAPAPAAAPVAAPVAAPAAAPAPAPAPAAEPDLLAAPDVPAVAPEVELKLPEGVTADDALLASFKPMAKELGLTSEKAQKLVDLYAGALKSNVEKTNAAWAEQQTRWQGEVKADKELGGPNYDGTKVALGRFFSAFDKDGSIRKDISALGLGNHPALVRLAVRAAKSISEDSVATTTAPGGGDKSEEEVLRARYPSMFPQQ